MLLSHQLLELQGRGRVVSDTSDLAEINRVLTGQTTERTMRVGRHATSCLLDVDSQLFRSKTGPRDHGATQGRADLWT